MQQSSNLRLNRRFEGAANVRCSRPLLGGGWLARPRWAEAAERPTQVAWAEPVAGTAGTEGGTASD